MTTFTLNEVLRNQVLAALDERAARLEPLVKNLQDRASVDWRIDADHCSQCATAVEDRQRALVWNIAALHETKQAREVIGEAEAAPDGRRTIRIQCSTCGEPWTDGHDCRASSAAPDPIDAAKAAADRDTAYPEPAAGWQESELRVLAGDR